MSTCSFIMKQVVIVALLHNLFYSLNYVIVCLLPNANRVPIIFQNHERVSALNMGSGMLSKFSNDDLGLTMTLFTARSNFLLELYMRKCIKTLLYANT